MTNRGDAGSCFTHLEGSLSGRAYGADQLIGTDPEDGRPLLARYDAAAARRSLTAAALGERRFGGLWRWREMLPVREQRFVASLGEGGTPMLAAPRLGAALGLPRLEVKAESLNPTGSFKARGMAVAVSRAVELGARRLVAPSAGNAAGALAAYAAAAGVEATVVMPADAPPANQEEVRICGAALVLVDGLISDCGRLARRLADELGMFDLSTLKEPYRVEGKKTMGYELAEAADWELPDAIVFPTGGGTGIVGMWKAFAELEALGLTGPARPRIYAVQAEGCAPLVRAFERGERFAEPWAGARTRAGGIRVPSAVGDFLVLDAVRESGGAALAVPEAAIDGMQRFAAARGAGFASLETSAAFAALPQLLERHAIARGERVVVFDTGAGHKSEPPQLLDLPRPVAADQEAWEPVVARVGRARPGGEPRRSMV
jgi:threonine synthase